MKIGYFRFCGYLGSFFGLIYLAIIIRDTPNSGLQVSASNEQPITKTTKLVENGISVLPDQRQRGLSWVGSRQIEKRHVEAIAELGCNWIVQTPFGWQNRHDSPDIKFSASGHLWGETDVGLAETNRLALELGIKVLLKPHIWLGRGSEGKWLADIAMTSEEDWQAWWHNYSTFMLHYAELAEREKIAGLCIGTELMGTVKTREADWRALIAAIRAIYHGNLTYAANWYQEYELVPFWDELDSIGIQAYFPLTNHPGATVAELVNGWQPHLVKIAEISKHFKKPVLFTELGYRASPDAASEPWLWPNPGTKATSEGLMTQERCYQAFFEAVWPQPWLEGVFVWKWHPLIIDNSLLQDESFTPQNKPALQVLKKYFQQQSQKP